jgi:hypothetical protein
MRITPRYRWLTGLLLYVCLQMIGPNVHGREQATKSHQSYTVLTSGLGLASASVRPNPDNLFYEGRGLSLGLGLGTEQPLSASFALTARLELFNSFGFPALVDGAEWSRAGMLTVGVIIGNVRRPGQWFASASVGYGAAQLREQDRIDKIDDDCVQCRRPREAGYSAGLASRLAVGLSGPDNMRIELAWLRVDGDGEDAVYPATAQVVLESIQVQFTSRWFGRW